LKVRKLQELKARKLPNSTYSSLNAEVESAINQFLSQSFEAEAELKAQFERKKIDVKTVDINWDRVKDLDTLYISKHFDLAEWWASEGRKKHALLSCAVPAILSLPASNGHQERTFSTCTHFNDDLRQRLSAEKFEQSILLAANKENTSIKIPTEEEAQAIIEEAIIKVTSKESNATIVASVLESLELDGLDDETFHDVAISLAEPRELFSNK
jgi:hypothetical protein